jgi:hypothetical protein
LVAALLLGGALLASFMRAPSRDEARVPASAAPTGADAATTIETARPRPEHEADPEVVSEVSALASAVKDLAKKQAELERADVRNAVPPPPGAFASPSACLESYLPELELAPGGLDFICKKSDLWAIDREAQVRIGARRGKGAELWKRLGHYSLASLAVMRSGCCPDAEPLSAVVPGLWCGILRDKVRALRPIPDPDGLRDFDATMACLQKRRARLPQHWDKLPASTRQQAFEEFSRRALARARPKATDERLP